MEEEEKRGKETKGIKGAETTRSKIKPRRGTIATIAKEVGGSTIAGIGRACSNGGSGENKCSDGVLYSEGRIGIA